MDDEKINKKMDDGVARFFTRFGRIFILFYIFLLLTCGRRILVSGTKNAIVVS